MTMNPALAIMLGFVAILPTTAIMCQYARGALFSRYEENKRRMLHWYIDHMPVQEVKVMIHFFPNRMGIQFILGSANALLPS